MSSSSSSSSMPRLGPAWRSNSGGVNGGSNGGSASTNEPGGGAGGSTLGSQGSSGRGFQPPPAVSCNKTSSSAASSSSSTEYNASKGGRDRSGSHASSGGGSSNSRLGNPFAMLDADTLDAEDLMMPPSSSQQPTSQPNNTPPTTTTGRFDSLRSSAPTTGTYSRRESGGGSGAYPTSSAAASTAPPPPRTTGRGRSLADLMASKTPSTADVTATLGGDGLPNSSHHRGDKGEYAHHHHYKNNSNGGGTSSSSSSHYHHNRGSGSGGGIDPQSSSRPTTNFHRTSSNSTTGTFEGGKFVVEGSGGGGVNNNSNRSLGGSSSAKNSTITDHHHHHHHRNISLTKSYDGHHDYTTTNAADDTNNNDDEEYANSSSLQSGGKNIIRYTREKLLSLRGRVDDDGNIVPTVLMELEDDIIISKNAQDPVCWDTFDADEIWASYNSRERGGAGGGDRHHGPMSEPPPPGVHRRIGGDNDHRRGSGGGGMAPPPGGFDSGRWQRGVALPASDDTRTLNNRGRADSGGGSGRGSFGGTGRIGGDYEADNPNDLWDDPVSSSTYGAASDFSAFGGSLENDVPPPRGRTSNNGGGMESFELSDISKAAAAFESELHGHHKVGSAVDSSREGTNDEDVGEDAVTRTVDLSRPLASTGTTIRSGSGDHVNVFEDFGGVDEDAAVTEVEEEEEDLPIKSGTGESNASSRLMKMIGVSGTGEASGGGSPTDANPTDSKKPVLDVGSIPVVDDVAPIPSNPWGAPASSLSTNPWGDMDSFGKQANETKIAAQRKQEEELLHQRQQLQKQEEEKKHWEAVQAKQAAEMRAAQQEQLEQIKQQQNQVELVLIERISNILETSWGRSDLTSILSTLHANDSRVIAILTTVEALRSLIVRHPQRIQLGRDPTVGAEMAALRMTNAQWQVHQTRAQAQLVAAQQLQAAQEQELQRRRQIQDEQARLQQQAKAEAMARAEEEKQQLLVVTDAPWFYADPQGNIQGPFGGDEMRQWLEAGYFKGNLPISQSRGGPFRALTTYFPDVNNAFHPTKPYAERDSSNVETKARVEEEAKTREKAAARAEVESNARTDARSLVNADSAGKSNQSSKLKMMLGLGAESSNGGGTIRGFQVQEPVSASAVVPTVKKQNKKTHQKQDQLVVPNEVPTAPAWGGVASAGPSAGQKKTMSEIQLEEAREAARREKESGDSGRSGGGWANIAASGGSTAWGGAAVLTPAAVVSPPTVTVAGLGTATSTTAAWNKPSVTAIIPQTATVPTAKKQSSNKVAAVDDNFGANGRMSPSLELWCKEQMERLNGTDDLTLIQFCMTLTDRDEIRQYLTAYLGSSPQVTTFATEFIRRKLGESEKKEEWESAGGKRKKKVGK